MERTGRSRGGFTISSFSVLTLLVFLAVAGVQMWQASSRPGFGSALVTIFLVTPVVIAIVLAGLAYLISRKSDSVANGTFTAVLLVAIVGRLVIMTGLVAKQAAAGGRQAAAPAATPSRPARAQPEELPRLMTPEPPRSVPVDPAPRADAPIAAAPTGPEARRPSPTLPRTTPAPRPRPAPRTAPIPGPAPQPVAENPAIKATLEALSTELDAAAGSLLMMAEPLLDGAAKPLPHLKTAIEQRLKDAAALHAASATLAERLRQTKDEAEKRLKDAGVVEHEAFSASVRYSLERRDSMRAVACEDYGRLCDAAREEAEFLLENISKWTLDPKGTMTWKDPGLKGQASSLRFRVEMRVKQREEMGARLRGK